MPGVAKLDPAKYLGEIKGINIPQITNDGKLLYAADTDLGVVGVIDPREDKVIKVIRVGKDPWRIYMSHDGKYAITPNNGDQTISIIDLRGQQGRGDARGRREHDRRELRRRQGVRDQLDQRLRLRLRHEARCGRPAGSRSARTSSSRRRRPTPQDEKIYLADSTENAVVIIDAKTEAFEKVFNVGLFPWGTHIMDSKDNYCH